ncbi:MAG: hypothetical protein WBC85_03160 [Planktotalea sp.]|uniref:hypothetical protein n=1 Tax=Planktotalea sp. TaxID=2029877 RepID=UPI003C787EA6
MTRLFVLSALLVSLAACNGTNPFMDDEADTSTTTTSTTTDPTTVPNTDVTTDSGDPISSDRTMLPGTANPSANNSIFRREASSSEYGNGYAESVTYNGANDTFTVDNLAFDGEDPYTAVYIDVDGDGTPDRFRVGSLSAFESPATAVDGLTSADITQLTYRALYGVSPDGNSSLAIIRTGAYIEYGFGGFVYQRQGGVTLPTSGQALYTGQNNYGGLRDFSGQGGLEYVNGDMEVRIDFDDFNEGSGVIGVVRNRRVFNLDGIDVTNDILDAFGAGTTQLPVARFVIQPGVIDSNGEIVGTIQSTNPFNGNVFEEGNYYAILSGDNATTVTGIIVMTADDPRYADVTVRETAGFFAVRQ